MDWKPFNPKGRLPPERRYVLVQIAARPEQGMPPSVAVGYLRIFDQPRYPFFVVPGFTGGAWEVTHWCDCLGDDFAAPLWPGTQRMWVDRNRRRAEV